MALSQLSFIGVNCHGQCLVPNNPGVCIAVPTAAPLDWLPDGKGVLSAVAGYAYTLMIAKDNRVYAVGANFYGQLGRDDEDRDVPDERAPRLVTGIGRMRITQIAAGFRHCAVVTEGGKLLLWGFNVQGQCGTGSFGGRVLTATRSDCGALADADVRVVFVACGGLHTVALTSDGGVITFGLGDAGQLGAGRTAYQATPERLACAALDGVRIVGCAAGRFFTQLVSDDGRVFATGENERGQLGTGDTTDVNTPTEIDAEHFGGAPIAAVSCGMYHTMAITRSEGKLFCWGRGKVGATGLGHTDDATTPQPVVGALADARVVRIAACYRHSCALADDGRVFAFGCADGIPAAEREGIPQLLQGGALAGDGAPVRALSVGCGGLHTALIAGTPPATPGFEAPLAFTMQKPGPKTPSKRAVAATAPLVAAQGKAAARADAVRGTKRKRIDSAGARAGDHAPL